MVNTRLENWERLLGLQLLHTYSQKLNAAFECLNSSGRGEFTLKDITEKGKFVFEFLCLEVDQDSSFSVMDTFRHFDRNSSRAVGVNAFVTGVVELLLQFSANMNKLQSIAMDLMPSGRQNVGELLLLIEAEDCPESYRHSLLAMNYLVKTRLLQAEKRKVDTLTTEMLVNLFKDALDNVIVEIQQYFHFSNDKMYKLICEFTGGQHNAAAHTLKANVSRDSRRHFKLQSLAAGSATITPSSAGAEEGGEHAGFLSQRNRRFSFQVQSSDGSSSHSGSVVSAHFVSPMQGGQHHKAGRHGAFMEDAPSRGGRRGSKISKHGPVHVSGPKHVTEDSVSSAMEFLTKLGFQSTAHRSTASITGKGGREQEYEDIDIKYQDIDSSELFMLQNAYKSINNFLDLTCGAKLPQPSQPQTKNPDGSHKHYDAITALLAPAKDPSVVSVRAQAANKTLFSPFLLPDDKLNDPAAQFELDMDDDGLPSAQVALKGVQPLEDIEEITLAKELVTSQDKLKRLSVRLEILESLQASMGLDSSTNFDEKIPRLSASTILKQAVDAYARKKAKFDETGHQIDFDDDEGEEEPATFQSIINEVNALKSSVAKKGLVNAPVGALLELPSAVIPLAIDIVGDLRDDQFRAVGPTVELMDFLSELMQKSEVLQEHIQAGEVDKGVTTKLQFKVATQEEQINELKSLLELKAHEQNEYLTASVELQMLREEVRVFRENGDIVRDLQLKNHELQKQQQELRRGLTESEKKNREMSLHLPRADSTAIETMSKNHQRDIDELEAAKSKLNKDTQRLMIGIKQSEQRTKAALQDQLTLRQRLNKAEEELSSANAFVTKLLGDIEIEKNQRTDRDELDLKVQELQRVIVARDRELIEAKELSAATRKLKLELHRAEEYASSLEEKIGEVTSESEKGLIAIEHLDKYREELRQKTVETRDMNLRLHSLESELREVRQFQVKSKLMEQELNELRIKAEKFPPLIVEITRLRSTAKSVARTLQEQDKVIVSSREKSKGIETEITRLKAEIRTLRDVESKLKEANIEIRRLQALVGEVNALKQGAKNAEEERKTLEDEYKKMRKYMRGSATNMKPEVADEASASAPSGMFGSIQEGDEEEADGVSTPASTAPTVSIPTEEAAPGPVDASVSEASTPNAPSDAPATGGGLTMAQRKAALGGFLAKNAPPK